MFDEIDGAGYEGSARKVSRERRHTPPFPVRRPDGEGQIEISVYGPANGTRSTCPIRIRSGSVMVSRLAMNSRGHKLPSP
jgi:hypothetical protein